MNITRRIRVFVVIAAISVTMGSKRPAAQSGYTLIPITSPFGATALDVNDNGVVVGSTGGLGSGYIWTQSGGLQSMPLFSGAPNDPTNRLRINNNGVVAGGGCGGGSVCQAEIWRADLGEVPLGYFAGAGGTTTSAVTDINDQGQVVGYSWGGGYNNFGPFIWSSGTGIQPLAGTAFVNGVATGINANGVVTGAATCSSPAPCPWVWSNNVLTPIPLFPGATEMTPMAINDFGVVVGRLQVAPDNHGAAFRWSALTGTEDLHAPAGLIQNMDINNAGDIVVTTISPGGVYLYSNGVWTNLNDLGFGNLGAVTGINNHGWMVGGNGWLLIPPNRPPTANLGTLTTDENVIASGTLSANDPDGDALTFSLVTNGTKGSVTITDPATGAFRYVPSLNAVGTDSFSFKANDGHADSNTATITVTILPITTCASDISTTVSVTTQGSVKLNKKTGRYIQSLTLKNGDGAVSGPISLVLVDLTSGAALFNATGTTTCAAPAGNPYINVDVGPDNVFSPRERASVSLEFTDPSAQAVTYTTRVLGGVGSR